MQVHWQRSENICQWVNHPYMTERHRDGITQSKTKGHSNSTPSAPVSFAYDCCPLLGQLSQLIPGGRHGVIITMHLHQQHRAWNCWQETNWPTVNVLNSLNIWDYISGYISMCRQHHVTSRCRKTFLKSFQFLFSKIIHARSLSALWGKENDTDHLRAKHDGRGWHQRS